MPFHSATVCSPSSSQIAASMRHFIYGVPSFSSAVQVDLIRGLQPLKLQGLKPLIDNVFRRD
jgi:hypothetical protein